MFILIAELSGKTFAIHETKSNKLQFFTENPNSFLSFLKETGHEVNTEKCLTFSNNISFDMFIKNYISEVIDKISLKQDFEFIEAFLKKNGTAMFRDSNFVFPLSEFESLELILWKNKVKTISFFDRKETGNSVRLDLDEEDVLGFYSPEKEPVFAQVVEKLKNLSIQA